MLLPSFFSSATCSYSTQDSNNCVKVSSGTGVVSVNIDSVNLALVDDLNVEFVDEKRTFNSHLLTREGENSNVFDYDLGNQPGIYKAVITGKDDLGDNFFYDNSTIVVDLYQPKAPVVPLVLTSQFKVQLEDSKDVLIVEDSSGTSVGTQSGSSREKTVDLSSVTSPLYLSFKVKSSNGLESVLTQRYYIQNVNFDFSVTVSAISLNENLMTQVNKVSRNEITHNKNIFVTGTANGKGVIYINGKKTQVSNGKFGSFVQLHQGTNSIIISNADGSSTTSYDVIYEPFNLYFKNVALEKIVSSKAATLSIEPSQDAEFILYVNGRFVSKQILTSGSPKSITLSGLQAGKNEISLIGPSNVRYDETIYYDTQSPAITTLPSTEYSNQSYFSAKIADDVGIDILSLDVKVDGITPKDISFVGDYIFFPLKGYGKGSHSVTLGVSDYVGNSTQATTSFLIDSSTSILTFENTEKSRQIGNELFVKSEKVGLTLLSQIPVAFKHITLDGVEVNDYRFNKDNSVSLTIDFKDKTTGVIDFEYIDSQDTSKMKTKSFTYTVQEKTPQIIIEPVLFSLTSSNDFNSYRKISGNIENSIFLDKNTLSINSKNTLFFNDHFEVFVDSQKSNQLLVKGTDLFGEFIDFNLDSTLFQSKDVILPLELEYSDDSFSLTFPNDQDLFEVQSLDGVHSLYNQLEDTDSLSVSQISGKRIVTTSIKKKDSATPFTNNIRSSIDSDLPYAFIYSNNNKEYLIVSDSTSKIKDVSLTSIGEETLSTCSQEFSLHSKCYDVTGKDTLSLLVVDSGNRSKNIDLSSLTPITTLPFTNLEGFYFTTLPKETKEDVVQVSGSYIVSGRVTSVSTQGRICEFDEETFICSVDIDGDTNFTLTADFIDVDGIPSSYSEEREITLATEPVIPTSMITDLTNTYGSNSKYYYFGEGDVTALFNLSLDSAVTLYLDGTPVSISEKTSLNDQITLPLNIHLGKKDQTEIVVELSAQNDDGASFSESVLLTYYRVKAFIFNIIIN